MKNYVSSGDTVTAPANHGKLAPTGSFVSWSDGLYGFAQEEVLEDTPFVFVTRGVFTTTVYTNGDNLEFGAPIYRDALAGNLTSLAETEGETETIQNKLIGATVEAGQSSAGYVTLKVRIG